jgi:UDP-glucuronate 4-epimerase
VSRPERILVTGAAGFIGSTLVDRLLSEGREVVGLDCFDPFYPEEQKHRNLAGAMESSAFSLVRGDVRDAGLVGRLFSEHRFDAVVHLAALAGVRPSLERPSEYADVNVTGSSVVFEAAARVPGPRVVFASSSSVYGERSDGPFSEADRVEFPISPYAATKKAGELIAHTFHHAFGMSVTALRFFTAYGPRQRPDLAIRKFADCIRAGDPVPVYGDGSQVRDFTYIDDVIDGVVRSVDTDLGYSILNLGAGRTISVLEMLQALETAIGTRARIAFEDKVTGDVSRTWADISAAREAIGYDPQTPFEEGIARFVEWWEATE